MSQAPQGRAQLSSRLRKLPKPDTLATPRKIRDRLGGYCYNVMSCVILAFLELTESSGFGVLQYSVFVLAAWFAPNRKRAIGNSCSMREASADRSSFVLLLNRTSDPHTCSGSFAATEPAACSCGGPLSDPAPGGPPGSRAALPKPPLARPRYTGRGATAD